MNNYILFAYISLHLLNLQGNQHEALDAVKKKWIDWAHMRVEAEKNIFLNHYQLKPQDLDDQELLNVLKSTHDQMIKKIVFPLKQKKYRSPFLCAARSAIAQEEAVNIIEHIARNIFIGPQCSYVEIFNDNTATDVSVLQYYATRHCVIMCDAVKQLKNVHELEEILLHEYSNIVHQDTCHKELLECLGWIKATDAHDIVTQKIYPFSHACKIRADVYAAINSINAGQPLTTFLERSQNNSYSLASHPKPSERIDVLKRIKTDFDAVIAQCHNNSK